MADLRNALMPSSSLMQYLQPWREQPAYQPPANPYKQPWDYPEWKARNGELRAPPDRPRDWGAPIAEAISPTMGAYGLGQGLGNVLMQGGQGNYASAAGELGLLAAGALMPGPKAAPKQGIRAYHGSPHDFDKFDMSKIGTGEGAQAYGHGLYFAENEGVAKSYKKNLAADRAWKSQEIRDAEPVLAQRLKDMGHAPDIADAVAQTTRLEHAMGTDQAALQRLYGAKGPEFNKALGDAWSIKDETFGGPSGRMYEVRINADPDDFLDWDKPLSAQSEKVRGAISSAGLDPWQVVDPSGFRRGPMSRAEAEQVSRGVAEPFMGARGKDVAELAGARRVEFGQQQKADVLRDAGIPGIRYLDQGSRTSGDGTSNYVLFRDDIIDIVKKYGIAAAASMYGMDAVMNATGQRNALMPEEN